MTPLIMETDSLVLKKVLDGIWEVPWSITTIVSAIQKLKRGQHVQIHHTFREGNTQLVLSQTLPLIMQVI